LIAHYHTHWLCALWGVLFHLGGAVGGAKQRLNTVKHRYLKKKNSLFQENNF
jgi:hypothetical protein